MVHAVNFYFDGILARTKLAMQVLVWQVIVKFKLKLNLINPFQVNVPFLYPLKLSEDRWFFEAFKGYKYRALVQIELNLSYPLRPRREKTWSERTYEVQKTSLASSEQLMYVQFTSCIYGGVILSTNLQIFFGSNNLDKEWGG